MLAHQRHECASTMLLFLVALFRLDNANKSLRFARRSYRNHQSPANLQLRDQRLRNVWSARRDEDRVVGRVRTPTECAVKTLYRGVVDVQLSDPRLRFAREIGNPFD